MADSSSQYRPPPPPHARACYRYRGALGRVADLHDPGRAEPLDGIDASPAEIHTLLLLRKLLSCQALRAWAQGAPVPEVPLAYGGTRPNWTTTPMSAVGQVWREQVWLSESWPFAWLTRRLPGLLSVTLNHASIPAGTSVDQFLESSTRLHARMRRFIQALRSRDPLTGGFITAEVAPRGGGERRVVWLHAHVLVLWHVRVVNRPLLEALWEATALPHEESRVKKVSVVKQTTRDYTRAVLYLRGTRLRNKKRVPKVLDPFWGPGSSQDIDAHQLWLTIAFHAHRGSARRWFGCFDGRTDEGVRRQAAVMRWTKLRAAARKPICPA